MVTKFINDSEFRWRNPATLLAAIEEILFTREGIENGTRYIAVASLFQD